MFNHMERTDIVIIITIKLTCHLVSLPSCWWVPYLCLSLLNVIEIMVVVYLLIVVDLLVVMYLLRWIYRLRLVYLHQ